MTAPAIAKSKGSLRWQPKIWEPVYEQIVILSVAGRSNKSLAEMFGYTEQHVCNILHTPQAALTRALILEKMHERALESIPAKLEATAVKAAQRIYDAIHDDDLFKEHPLSVLDRSIEVLKAAGHIKTSQGSAPGVNVNAGGRAFILTEAAAERIRETTKMLESGDAKPIAENVEYETVDAKASNGL